MLILYTQKVLTILCTNPIMHFLPQQVSVTEFYQAREDNRYNLNSLII